MYVVPWSEFPIAPSYPHYTLFAVREQRVARAKSPGARKEGNKGEKRGARVGGDNGELRPSPIDPPRPGALATLFSRARAGWIDGRGGVQSSGFRVQGSGFRVQGSGFRVQSSGFRVGPLTSGISSQFLKWMSPSGPTPPGVQARAGEHKLSNSEGGHAFERREPEWRALLRRLHPRTLLFLRDAAAGLKRNI